MNIMEKLAREIARVAVIQDNWKRTNNGNPHPLLTVALEQAYEAAGLGDALAVIRALKAMEDITNG